MLRSMKELTGYTLQAKDGEIGRCKDFLVDENGWKIRYMVADTRKWLPGRKVLVTPLSLDTPQWEDNSLPVLLTQEQIKNAPDLDADAPVTREYEIWWHEHYGWNQYWAAGPMGEMVHAEGVPSAKQLEERREGPDLDNTHLHSLDSLLTYGLRAKDGEVGQVEDLIFDDQNWTVLYMAVNTGSLLSGGEKVLVPIVRTTGVDWRESRVEVDLYKEKIQDSPPFDPSQPVNAELTTRHYDYQGRPVD